MMMNDKQNKQNNSSVARPTLEGSRLPPNPDNTNLKKTRHSKGSSPFTMLIFSIILIAATLSKHKDYASFLNQETTKTANIQQVVPKKLTPLSQNTLALQQQVQQMKELMERRREMQSLEMEVLRHELGTAPQPIATEEVQQQLAASQTNNDGQISQDVNFARDLAKEAVRQEVEDFLDKVDLISKIGSYVSKRVQE